MLRSGSAKDSRRDLRKQLFWAKDLSQLSFSRFCRYISKYMSPQLFVNQNASQCPETSVLRKSFQGLLARVLSRDPETEISYKCSRNDFPETQTLPKSSRDPWSTDLRAFRISGDRDVIQEYRYCADILRHNSCTSSPCYTEPVLLLSRVPETENATRAVQRSSQAPPLFLLLSHVGPSQYCLGCLAAIACRFAGCKYIYIYIDSVLRYVFWQVVWSRIACFAACFGIICP